MGGGWTSSRAAQQRRDLLARSAADAEDDAGGQGIVDEEEPAPPRQKAGRRHCWVVLDDVEPMPGVVAAWDRNETGTWMARVSYVLDDTGSVVTGWLPASCLRPYPSAPPSPRAPTD